MVYNVHEFERTIRHIKEIYERRYAVTLAPTPENIGRALALYARAVETHKTLYSIILEAYGYRYRRMENFMRELGLWKPGEGWLHPRVLAKIYFNYFGRNSVEVEITFSELVPEHLAGRVDWGKVNDFIYDMISQVDWYWTAMVCEMDKHKTEFKVGIDERVEWGYLYCCNQAVEIKMTLWKQKRGRWHIADTAEFEIKMANYVLHGVKVREEEEDWAVL